MVYSKNTCSINGIISFLICFREMKFNRLTYNVSFGILIVTVLYTLVYSGLTGLLLCSSVSLITAAFLDQFEIVVAISVIFALFYIYYLKGILRKLEPFQDNASTVVKRVNEMKYAKAKAEPVGVYDGAIEGFADAGGSKDPAGTTESSSAPKSDIKNAVEEKFVNDVTDAIDKSEDKKSKKENIENIKKEEFQSATNELFKLGKMPSEHSDGPKLDAGSTLLKAMGSFKPEQISAMSSDTKQLLETQKSLMGMLTQMRPVLADGKELLQTFSGMFGGEGGKFTF